MQIRTLFLMAGMLAALSGCKRADSAQGNDSTLSALPPGHVPITPSATAGLAPATQALLDSGNSAFRTKEFELALRYYAKASAAQPDHAAPWFGTYMVGQATGNTVLADSALRMVRERAPGMQAHPGVAPPAGSPASPYSPHQSVPPGARTPVSGTPS